MQISVIIPTFNRIDLVCEAIKSVLNQKYPVDDILVIDDGSTDGTVDRLVHFSSAIRVFTQKNLGVSKARNRGISLAKHDWLAFLDSDDLWKPAKLTRQKQALLENPDMRFCYTNEEWRKNGLWMNQKKRHQKRSGWIYEECLPLCIISPSSALIHRSVFDQVGVFNPNLPACEDYELWLRICSRMPVLYLDEKLIIKRAGDWDQLSQQHSLDKFRIISLRERLLSGELSLIQQEATAAMFRHKIQIYKLGCIKHRREDELQWLQSIMDGIS
ncbi:MAG: glycosyltransferase [Calditrichaeota bacterium]|nr:MAG: glycosyltransferase [Calditrichota bacterium]